MEWITDITQPLLYARHCPITLKTLLLIQYKAGIFTLLMQKKA